MHDLPVDGVQHGLSLGALAADSSVLADALDRQVNVHMLLQSSFYGELEGAADCHSRRRILGIVETDAKSVCDHLHKTGSTQRKRQAFICLLVVRNLVEDAVVKVKWVRIALGGGHLDEG